jgi:hypothetical protein
VCVAEPCGLAESDAVDQAGVVQGVADDGVLLAEEHLKESAVGVETGTIEDRVLGAQEGADRLFKLCVEILRAADESDGGHAIAMFL